MNKYILPEHWPHSAWQKTTSKQFFETPFRLFVSHILCNIFSCLLAQTQQRCGFPLTLRLQATYSLKWVERMCPKIRFTSSIFKRGWDTFSPSFLLGSLVEGACVEWEQEATPGFISSPLLATDIDHSRASEGQDRTGGQGNRGKGGQGDRETMLFRLMTACPLLFRLLMFTFLGFPSQHAPVTAVLAS